MIDDVEKSVALVEKMQATLPMRAYPTKRLRRTLQQGSKRDFPRACRVTGVRYLSDEGGSMCDLDFGFDDAKQAHIVSITHLTFDRGHPLAREIKTYCKHRIKQLKKLHGGMVPT